MGTLVEDFLASDEYAESTKVSYRRILDKLVQAEDLASWTASDLLSFVKANVKGNERQNTQQYVALCACRSFLAWRYGQVHPARAARIKRVLPKKQRALTMSQLVELLALFDTSTPIGARDLALAAIAIDTGLRRSELARIRLADVDLQNLSLQVIVKGGQWGKGLYSPQTAVFIEDWLNLRQPAKGVDTLFISLRGSQNHKEHGQPLTSHGIKMIFRKWSKHLGFQFTPHDARRTFATITHLLQAPTKAAMAAGRWRNMEVYEKYLIDVAAEQIRPYLPVENAVKLHKR
ncbi:MAG: tyrosine-type recombinase/integrase [Chloroflexi bacterium]|nr:tyrosine-type recombinase/integrase [Chloroflexota bacterium]